MDLSFTNLVDLHIAVHRWGAHSHIRVVEVVASRKGQFLDFDNCGKRSASPVGSCHHMVVGRVGDVRNHSRVVVREELVVVDSPNNLGV